MLCPPYFLKYRVGKALACPPFTKDEHFLLEAIHMKTFGETVGDLLSWSITAATDLGYATAAYTAAFFMQPGVSEAIHKRRVAFHESIQKNKQLSQEAATDILSSKEETKQHRLEEEVAISDLKAQTAAIEAATAGQIKEHQEEKAKSLSQKEIHEEAARARALSIQENTKAEIQILREKEQGKIKETQAREQQEIESAYTNTQQTLELQQIKHKQALKQKETSHDIKVFEQTRDHLDALIKLETQRTEAINSTTESAENYGLKAQFTLDAINELNKVMDKVIETDRNLQTALAHYNDLIAYGEDTQEQEKAIRSALRKAMRSDIQLDTKIATDEIEHQSKIQQTLKKDLAKKNKEFETLIGQYSQETLAKLSELVQKEIEIEKAKIPSYTDLKDIEPYQANLNKLYSYQIRVNNAISLKENETQKTNELPYKA